MTAALLLIAMKSLLIAAVTLGLLRLAARRSSAERSIIAHLGLCALLALPLANVLPPLLSIPEPLALKALQGPMSVIVTPISLQPAAAFVPAATGAGPAQWIGTFVLCAYLAPAIILLLGMCAALLQLFTLRVQARPVVDAVWRNALARAQSRMGFTKDIALLSGSDISSPISWGLLRPAILVNAETLAALEQAEAIIAHELAHVIQHDWAKLILARIATAVFWFNPLVWLLAREAHQLREEAADDAVLAADIAGPDYAALLIGVARCESRRFLAVVHGMAPRRSSLHRRVTRVLDDRSVRTGPDGGRIAALAAATLVMAAPLAALRLEPAVPRTAGAPEIITNAVITASALFTPPNAQDLVAPTAPQSAPSLTHEPSRQSAGQPDPVPVVPAKKHSPAAPAAPRSTKPPQRRPDDAVPQPQADLTAFPQVLRRTLDDECVGSGGTPGQSPNLLTTADLNGDGLPDLVFDRMNYECRGAAVGSGRYGTTLTVFMSSPSNSVAEVYTGSFYGSWVDYSRDGKPSLIVADTADCRKSDMAGSPMSGWESCGHRVALDAPGMALGAEPATDKAADR